VLEVRNVDCLLHVARRSATMTMMSHCRQSNFRRTVGVALLVSTYPSNSHCLRSPVAVSKDPTSECSAKKGPPTSTSLEGTHLQSGHCLPKTQRRQGFGLSVGARRLASRSCVTLTEQHPNPSMRFVSAHFGAQTGGRRGSCQLKTWWQATQQIRRQFVAV
jgi:hypothetical protein